MFSSWQSNGNSAPVENTIAWRPESSAFAKGLDLSTTLWRHTLFNFCCYLVTRYIVTFFYHMNNKISHTKTDECKDVLCYLLISQAVHLSLRRTEMEWFNRESWSPFSFLGSSPPRSCLHFFPLVAEWRKRILLPPPPYRPCNNWM